MSVWDLKNWLNFVNQIKNKIKLGILFLGQIAQP